MFQCLINPFFTQENALLIVLEDLIYNFQKSGWKKSSMIAAEPSLSGSLWYRDVYFDIKNFLRTKNVRNLRNDISLPRFCVNLQFAKFCGHPLSCCRNSQNLIFAFCSFRFFADYYSRWRSAFSLEEVSSKMQFALISNFNRWREAK